MEAVSLQLQSKEYFIFKNKKKILKEAKLQKIWLHWKANSVREDSDTVKKTLRLFAEQRFKE